MNFNQPHCLQINWTEIRNEQNNTAEHSKNVKIITGYAYKITDNREECCNQRLDIKFLAV